MILNYSIANWKIVTKKSNSTNTKSNSSRKSPYQPTLLKSCSECKLNLLKRNLFKTDSNNSSTLWSDKLPKTRRNSQEEPTNKKSKKIWNSKLMNLNSSKKWSKTTRPKTPTNKRISKQNTPISRRSKSSSSKKEAHSTSSIPLNKKLSPFFRKVGLSNLTLRNPRIISILIDSIKTT